MYVISGLKIVRAVSCFVMLIGVCVSCFTCLVSFKPSMWVHGVKDLFFNKTIHMIHMLNALTTFRVLNI